MSQDTFVVLDTETTGLSPHRGDGIIEIAAIKFTKEDILETYTTFVNPLIPISHGAAAVHGLDDAFIAHHGKRIEEVFPFFRNFCNNTILVGHNIKNFDLPFINKHLLEIDYEQLDNPILDTLYLARKKLKLPNYKLHTVADYYNINYDRAHRALDDTLVNKEVFIKLYFD